MQIGDLLFGGVGGKDVDELVLTIWHCCSSRTRPASKRWIPQAAATGMVARCPSTISGLFGCRWIAAVVLIHHRGDPGNDERVCRIGRPRNHAVDVGGFVFVEAGQHVVGEIAPGVTAADAEPQSPELFAE